VFIVLSQLLSKVTDTSCSFYIKCSMYPPCCWTTHSSRRRHWSMARSVAIVCHRSINIHVDKAAVQRMAKVTFHCDWIFFNIKVSRETILSDKNIEGVKTLG